jgi:DNA-directed RNA polymerase specialized sigma24 family protein
VELGAAADLVVRARDGDQGAWGDLVDRYLGMVHAICRGYHLGGEDAADVNQVVWLRLVEHLGRIRSPDAIGGWIAATARNECVRVLRSSGRTVPVEEVDLDGLEGGAAGPVDLGLLVYERDRVLMSAFGCLDMADPRPSYGEIGAALDMPVGSIGPTRARCLEQLRRLMP